MFSAEYLSRRTVFTFRLRAVVAVGVSVAGTIACFLAAHASGVQLVVTARHTRTTEVPLGAVVVATVVSVGAAVAVAVLARRAARPRAAFLAVTAIGLALTTVPPITAAADMATAAWLLVMHAIVAAGTIPTLASTLPARRDDGETTWIASRQ